MLCSLPDDAGPGVAGLTQSGARERTLAEHCAILDSLAAGDAEVARSWATVHIASVEEWLVSVL